jgi:SAM-dependent methyltransferase
MNNVNAYDQFSEDYDRFVNWDARLAVEIPFLASELKPQKPSENGPVFVLDAACGTGQHVIALSKLGFQCAGADYSARMIETAQYNATVNNLEIPFKQAGFGELAEAFGKESFDRLVCLGNSLPHVLDEVHMMQTLADFRAVLRPGGKIIFQNRNFDQVMRTRNRWMPPQTHHEGEKTWIFTRFYDFDPDGRITFNIMTLFSERGGEFQQRMISTRLWPLQQAEMVELLERAGFTRIRFFGDLQGADYEPAASGNLVITAQS